MHAHKEMVTVNRDREVVVRLPSDFPQGEAEVIVVSKTAHSVGNDDLCVWLEEWALSLPTAPYVSLEAMDRDSVYR
jgi:hypothetical protein